MKKLEFGDMASLLAKQTAEVDALKARLAAGEARASQLDGEVSAADARLVASDNAQKEQSGAVQRLVVSRLKHMVSSENFKQALAGAARDAAAADAEAAATAERIASLSATLDEEGAAAARLASEGESDSVSGNDFLTHC